MFCTSEHVEAKVSIVEVVVICNVIRVATVFLLDGNEQYKSSTALKPWSSSVPSRSLRRLTSQLENHAITNV